MARHSIVQRPRNGDSRWEGARLLNVAELARVLARIGIPPEVVALGGHADLSWCVERSPAGVWEVYWSERGHKNGLVQLASEADACFQLLGRLFYYQLQAETIGPTHAFHNE